MSGTIPALMETNSVWKGIFGLQPHSSISLLQNRHMENCGALVSPSTCCCSALPCRGSRSWRTATSDVTLSGYLTVTGKCSLTDNDYSPGNLCLDGIDVRLEELHSRGVNFVLTRPLVSLWKLLKGSLFLLVTTRTTTTTTTTTRRSLTKEIN